MDARSREHAAAVPRNRTSGAGMSEAEECAWLGTRETPTVAKDDVNARGARGVRSGATPWRTATALWSPSPVLRTMLARDVRSPSRARSRSFQAPGPKSKSQRRYACLAFSAIAGLAGRASPAVAQQSVAAPITARLEWDAGTGCPTSDMLARATELRLNRPVFVTDRADVTVRGRVRIDDAGHVRAELELLRSDGDIVGTRELATTSSDCAALGDALPLIVALMVDLPRDHVSLRIPTPPPPETPAPSGPAARPWGWGLEVGPTFALGLLPGVHGGARAGVELRAPELLALRTTIALWAPADVEVPIGRSRSWAVLGGAAACLGALLEIVSFYGCAGADVGYFEAEGRGFDDNFHDSGLLISTVGAVEGGVRLGGAWWIALELRLLVPLIRRAFRAMTPGGEVVLFESAPVTGDVALVLAARFDS